MITKVVHIGLLLNIKPLYLNKQTPSPTPPPPPPTKITNKIKLRHDLFIQKLTLKILWAMFIFTI